MVEPAVHFCEVEPGVRLAYKVIGTPKTLPPLILIQGLTGVKEDWGQFAFELAKDRPVLMFDNRGIGESSVPDGPYTVSQMAMDTLKLASYLGWDYVDVGGISMGGMITQWVVLVLDEFNATIFHEHPTHSDFLRAMSEAGKIAMAGGKVDNAMRRAMMERSLAVNLTKEFCTSQPTRFSALVDEFLRYKRPVGGIVHQASAVSTHDSTTHLRLIAEKVEGTLVIHGDSDLVVPFANGLHLAKNIPRAKLVVLNNCGHIFWQMDDGQSAAALSAFLAQPMPKL